MSDNVIRYESDNGYTGFLYGKSSMRIIDNTGKEVFHTGFRTVNTLGGLKQQVDTMPEFVSKLTQMMKSMEE